MGFKINKDMLPMKGHYFLFNAGTAPLVPYLPTYAKQLGFSTYVVGIIYTFLPIFGMIAKPVFGAIGDKFEKHKFIFILFQILTIFAFSGLYFIKEVPHQSEVHLSCGNGESFFDICSTNSTSINECAAIKVSATKKSVQCDMSCAVDKPFMWQTICQDWRIPKYCFNTSTDYNSIHYYEIELNRQLHNVNNNCLLHDVSSDTPCTQDLNLPMYANCSQVCGSNITDTISDTQHLVCNGNSAQLKICPKPGIDIGLVLEGSKNNTNCKIRCIQSNLNSWSNFCVNTRNSEIICRNSMSVLPDKLNFTGVIPLDKTVQEGKCVYFKLFQVLLNDGSLHYPICSKESASQQHFHSQCKIKCENPEMNELLSSATVQDGSTESAQHHQLWMFFLLMTLNWIGMAVVVSIADAICFEKLGENVGKYGQQRLWGSAGWGIFSLLTGYLIDTQSRNQGPKNYLIAFILMLIFLSLDVIVSMKLRYQQKKMSVNLLRKVGLLFTNRRTCHFFVWIVLVGMCTGLLWQFLFWYLEDLATATDCSQTDWIKTLQGFVSGIQCFLGEIPFLFFSGRILKKIGHIHAMSLVLLGFGVRFVLYSILTNPWWVLPIELLQGLTFGILYANMTSYASIIAPEGTEATLQGLVGAIFEGVGTSLGSFVGGMMYGKLGGALTFRIYGCVALGACVLNVAFSHIFCKTQNASPQRPQQEYASIIHYAAPNDAIDLVNDH